MPGSQHCLPTVCAAIDAAAAAPAAAAALGAVAAAICFHSNCHHHSSQGDVEEERPYSVLCRIFVEAGTLRSAESLGSNSNRCTQCRTMAPLEPCLYWGIPAAVPQQQQAPAAQDDHLEHHRKQRRVTEWAMPSCVALQSWQRQDRSPPRGASDSAPQP